MAVEWCWRGSVVYQDLSWPHFDAMHYFFWKKLHIAKFKQKKSQKTNVSVSKNKGQSSSNVLNVEAYFIALFELNDVSTAIESFFWIQKVHQDWFNKEWIHIARCTICTFKMWLDNTTVYSKSHCKIKSALLLPIRRLMYIETKETGMLITTTSMVRSIQSQ